MYDNNPVLTDSDLSLAEIGWQDGLFDDRDAEFLQAFLELLAIQQKRNAEPIVVFRDGPQPVH